VNKLRLALVAVGLMCIAILANADTVLGVPVTGIGTTTQAVSTCPTLEGQVCYNSATGQTTFYIPLSSANSGTFGVTSHSGGTAGTFADTGMGTSNALTMYLMFNPVTLPVNSATLNFTFTDLDLQGVNDPTGFFENVQFFSNTGTALTPLIYTNGQSGGGALAYTVTGNSNTQTIFFSNVTSILQNPFYVQLNFGSSFYTTGLNTPEDLIATLQTTQATPEPSTMLLLGAGLLGSIKLFRRK
jgi:hypothetical protein